jgi:tRNA threonylcarbamoyladenosine biosynthesis protein TsaB
LKRILALDTSTWWGGAALLECGPAPESAELVAELGLRVAGSHAERLPGSIERLLAEAGWSRGSLDAFAATRGPGSFTGVRVGLGILCGLALASDRPCYGVTTLEALVEAHGPADRERVALVAAGRGELYAGRFDGAASPPLELEPPWVTTPAELSARLAAGAARLIPAYGTALDALRAGAEVERAPAPRGVAAAAGRLVALLHPGLPAPAPPLVPVYVRPPDVRLPRER